MVSIVGVCRASRGLIQAFASLFHCRPCRFHGHRTSGQATFVATFSRLLAIFCTFRTFCPTRCFVDKILRVYMCQTIYVYIYPASDPTTVKLFRVFQSSYERTVMLCSSNIDFKELLLLLLAFYKLRIQSTTENDEIQDIGIVR